MKLYWVAWEQIGAEMVRNPVKSIPGVSKSVWILVVGWQIIRPIFLDLNGKPLYIGLHLYTTYIYWSKEISLWDGPE